jgi:hypothetical protein
VKVWIEERAVQKQEKQYWDNVKRNGWGDKLHEFIKVSAQNPHLTVRIPQNLMYHPFAGTTKGLQCSGQNSRKRGRILVWLHLP